MSDQQPQPSWWLYAGDFLHILNFLHHQVKNISSLHLIIGGTCLILLPQSVSAGLTVLGSTLICLTRNNNNKTAVPNHVRKARNWISTLYDKACRIYQTLQEKSWYQLILCIVLICSTAASLYTFCGLVVNTLGWAGRCIQIILFYLSAYCMISVQQYKNTHHNNNRPVLENLQYYSMQPYFALTTTLTITSVVSSLLFTNITFLWLAIILAFTAVVEHQYRQAKSSLSTATIPTEAPSSHINQVDTQTQTNKLEEKSSPTDTPSPTPNIIAKKHPVSSHVHHPRSIRK